MRRCTFCAIVLLTCVTITKAQLLHDVIHVEVDLYPSEIRPLGKTFSVRTVSQELREEFTGIALQGFTDSELLFGLVRFFEDEVWGEWQRLYVVRSATDEAFLAAYRGKHVRNASEFELLFQVDSSSYGLRFLSAGSFDARRDGIDELDREHLRVKRTSDFLIQAPHIRLRTEWRAQPFRGSPVRLNRPSYDYMTLHHTAGFSAKTLADGLEQVRRIQEFHQTGRGWSDIGYQFLMDQEGRLYQGRPFLNDAVPFDQGPTLVQGAHVGGANRGNIGVSLMGCYHPSEGTGCQDKMTSEAIDSLVVMFGFLSERYGVDPDEMRGHRDFNATSCPGENNYQLLPDFRLQVEDLLLHGNKFLGEGTITARLNQSGDVSIDWEFTMDNGIREFIVQRRMEDNRVVEIARGQGAVNGSSTDLPGTGRHRYELLVLGEGGGGMVLSTVEIIVETSITTSILAQSFPNPASSEAVVRYFLQDESGIVRINVYDLTGRIVLEGENQYRESGQWHVATLDTSALSDGVYMYRITVDGFASTVFKASRPLIILQ